MPVGLPDQPSRRLVTHKLRPLDGGLVWGAWGIYSIGSVRAFSTPPEYLPRIAACGVGFLAYASSFQ
jgi:hypothetical protein